MASEGKRRHGGGLRRPRGGGRFTAAFIERWIGCVDAFTGDRYVLGVEVPSGVGALRPFAPRFLVTSAALDREHQSLTAAVWLTSLLVALGISSRR